MNADPGVHVRPIRLFTMRRSRRSPSAGIRTLAAGYWLFGRVLLLFAVLRLRCRGVVVSSSSPIW